MKLRAWFVKNWWRLGVSIVWDGVIDNTVGRIPVVGTVIDAIGGLLGFALWGPSGLLGFGELVDVTDQVDGFIPLLTISGLYRLYAETR